jgi:transcriptional regulator with XRE-family HTH domain
MTARADGTAARRLRLARGLSQEELAEVTGLTRRTIGNIERGRVVPLRSTALLLAAALRCSLEDLRRVDG